jgi:3-oxoacyl-[acyl-carrier protein] reductase
MRRMSSKDSLAGRMAVVTGGSSGIGAACVRLLAAEGARVVIGYHRGADRAEALARELPGTGHVTMRIPLEDAGQHSGLHHQLAQLAPGVDILVNSAGFTQRIPHGDLETLTPELFNRLLTANAGGPYSITRALMPLLRASGSGLVVNVSSVSAFTGAGSNIAYCAAKAALDTMTQSLARACGPQVRFLSVSPAAVDTGFLEGRSRAELEKKAAQTPLGRIVTPEDVARAVLACATLLTTATGTRIVIDGGHTL